MVKHGPKVVEGVDVVSIREFFDKLPDSRSTVNQKHRLGEIIVIWVWTKLGVHHNGLWALISHGPRKGRHSIMRRRMAAWSEEFQAQVLALKAS
jgi:hypothetical protein